MRKLTTLLLLLACTACFKSYKKVEFKAKEIDPQKLVVVSFISPQDTSLLVSVSRTQSATAESNLLSGVPDATVTISNGTQSVALTKLNVPASNINGYLYGPHNPNRTYYSYRLNGSFLIQAESTYTVRVETPYGETASGTCTVPTKVNTSLTSISEKKSSFDNNFFTVDFLCKWQDSYPDLTYYTLTASAISYDTLFLLKTYLTEPAYDTIASAKQIPYNVYNGDRNVSPYPSNENRREFNYTLTGDMQYVYHLLGEDDVYNWKGKEYFTAIYRNSIEAKIYLSITDEHYYRYHTSLESFNRDDFFSEPAKVYTNIENGYGVFAAKNSYIVQDKVKVR